MKKINFLVVILIIIASCKTQKPLENKKFALTTEIDKVSYSIGVNVAHNLKTQGMDSLNIVALTKAFSDVYADDSLLVNTNESGKIINQYLSSLQSKKGDKNKAEGQKFLDENKKNPAVIVLPSGLQYIVLKEGTGEKPTATDKVKTHYHGTLINGKVFDSSVQRGEPISFPVNGVIAGWTEALQLMKTGSKWKLFIPSDLAYGERGAGDMIGPNTSLIFEVELISIEK